MGELPEQLPGNISILNRLQQQLIEKHQSLRDEKNRLISIENQLKITRSQANDSVATLSDGDEATNNEELNGKRPVWMPFSFFALLKCPKSFFEVRFRVLNVVIVQRGEKVRLVSVVSSLNLFKVNESS